MSRRASIQLALSLAFPLALSPLLLQDARAWFLILWAAAFFALGVWWHPIGALALSIVPPLAIFIILAPFALIGYVPPNSALLLMLAMAPFSVGPALLGALARAIVCAITSQPPARSPGP